MSHSRFLLSCLFASWLCPSAAHAQEPIDPPVSSLLQHIEVTLVAPGEDTEILSRAHFVITQQGRRYMVRVAHPSTTGRPPAAPVATHLLLIVPTGAERWLNPNKLLQELEDPFERGWQISVVRPDGYATLYISTAPELRAALAAPAQTGAPSNRLFNDFQNLPGRRVLIIAGTPDPVERDWIARTNNIYPIYIADVPPKSLSPREIADDETCLSDHISATTHAYVDGIGFIRVARCVPPEDNTRYYAEGLDREHSLPNALKAAVRDSHNFYDLTFQPDITSPAPITLTLKHMHSQKVTVDTYVSTTVTDSRPPEIMRSQSGLIVEQDGK